MYSDEKMTAVLKRVSQPMKVNEICRTCMVASNELHSIFEDNTCSYRILDMITAVTGLKFEISDGLPTSICSQCKKMATDAYNFKTKSLEADTTLRDMIKKKETPSVTSFIGFEDTVKLEDEINLKYENFYEEGTCNDVYNCLSTTEDDFSNIDIIKNENPDKLVDKNQESMDKIKVEKDISYCPVCGLNSDSEIGIANHILKQHAEVMGPKKRGRPKTALAEILSKVKINKVYFKHPKNKKYNCFICDGSFASNITLAFHMKEHKEAKVICCTLCKTMFLNEQNYASHVCNENKLQDDYVLKNVTDVKEDEKFFKLSLEALILSNNMTNWDKLLICQLCTAIFFSLERLTEHNDIYHPAISKRCHKCLKVFTTYRAAAHHRALCKNVNHIHKCTTCDVRFASEISLNKHILKQHKGQSVSIKFMDSKQKLDDKKFMCTTCNKSFYRQELLDRHCKLHQPNQKLFECDICNKKCTSKDSLREHSKCHNPDREKILFTCQYCGRHFSNSSNLIVHMRRHTGEKPYKCDFCQKGFPRSSDLLCHRRSHTGEKPCLCTICGKGFSRSNKLSRHMRVHTGQKPYKCIYCEKAFTQSNDLTLHIRRHTGDKPYVCEICGDRFIQGTALQNHRKAHGHFPTTSSSAQDRVQGILEKTLHTGIIKISKRDVSAP